MKRLLTISLTIFIALAFLGISEAQKKANKAKQKNNPCVAECNKVHKKCLNAAKKANKTARRGKLVECNKAQKECKANCNNPADEEEE
ncbi:MAG: hypothetical protein JXN64_00190 [Spirochaetes bacterium]|nr:hypothetical protein [Spirochaetota bacterium]